MAKPIQRRYFIKRSIGASLAASVGLSFEEQALLAQQASRASRVRRSKGGMEMPMGTIGDVEISRLICGGNLISGYAHSRDLIYVSQLLKHYFTDEKIMQTWELCEAHGINTMICYPNDRHAIEVYRTYRSESGGRIQYLAQIAPELNDLQSAVKDAVDAGASGAFLVGNKGDEWTREGRLPLIRELIARIKDAGLIAGVAGHSLRTPQQVEEAGIEPDFYMKTLHSNEYWSKRRPDQNKEVIDNYLTDNYWCMDPAETIAFMSQVKRPWIAYKVLAAGAIQPRDGFKFAFENGADFACVGMFDFQVADDATIATNILTGSLDRKRPWMA